MSRQQVFTLHPFDPLPIALALNGAIARCQQQLTITYTLTGDLTAVVIAPPTTSPHRRHELWQQTCFELFLGIPDSSRYWEFNLSPASHWNSYRFEAYRQGMAEETAFRALPFQVQQQSDQFSLTLELDLAEIAPTEQVFDVAITAVVQYVPPGDRPLDVSYWALTHPEATADFHQRDGFLLQI